MVKVTNIEQVNGVPCVKARVVTVATEAQWLPGEQLRKFGMRILVSPDEYPTRNDEWYYIPASGGYMKGNVPDGSLAMTYRRILAMPENLSQASLELIRAGKITEGSEIWLECKEVPTEDPGPPPGGEEYQVWLDENGHVIIHQQEKPRLYTPDDMKNAYFEGFKKGTYLEANKSFNFNTREGYFNDWLDLYSNATKRN